MAVSRIRFTRSAALALGLFGSVMGAAQTPVARHGKSQMVIAPPPAAPPPGPQPHPGHHPHVYPVYPVAPARDRLPRCEQDRLLTDTTPCDPGR